MDIAAWLRSLGLERYVDAFRENAIDSDILTGLTADDLKEIGVAAVGDRRRLLDAIAALRDDRGRQIPSPHPASPARTGERRPVTVLFADLSGYTALSRRLDPEELHILLDRFFERIDRIVLAYGGHVDKHIGDCVMAVFGAPIAHGNDAERAVRAALAIRETMPVLSRETGHEVEIHIGIAGGQVVAGRTGGENHGEYTMVGESVNLASRLTDAGGPGEILASDPVWQSLSERLDGAEAGRIVAKGYSEPVRAWRIHGLRAAARVTPFVGRSKDLARLQQALDACRERQTGQTIHIRGEAGIGKTRLVEEFEALARRAGFSCHVGLVLDFGIGPAGDAVPSLVRSLLGLEVGSPVERVREAADRALQETLVEAGDAVFLNDLLDLPQPTELRTLYDAMGNARRQQGRTRVVSRLVREASRRSPLLLVIEDLHWADARMLWHLAALAETITQCPVLMVTTTRPEGDPLSHDWWRRIPGAGPVIIDLGPLHRSEALALARALSETPKTSIERCLDRAGGNPLFLEQMIRHAEESSGTAVPHSVRSLVQARLDRLPPDDKEALQAASIMGQRFSRDALCFLLDRPDYTPERLEANHLVRPQESAFLFAHALIRDAVYDSVLKSRQRALHRKAALWYSERDPTLQAEHLDCAEDPEAPAAWLRAARAQAAEYRYDLALQFVDRGLARAADRADRFALSCCRGEILHDLGNMPEAGEAFRAGLELAASEAERCHALIGTAGIKRIIEDLDGAAEDLDEAERIAGSLNLIPELARIHFLKGNLSFPRGDIDRCLVAHRRSLKLARQIGSRELEAAALGGLGDAEYARGRMRSAYERFRRCVALCREHGLGRIEVAHLPMTAITRWYAGDIRGSLVDSLEATASTARVGHARAEIIARHAAYLCSLSLLDLPTGMEHIEASLILSCRLGARRFEAESLAFRANLHRLAGAHGQALSDARQAVAICRETGMSYFGPTTLGILAATARDPDERNRALAEGETLLAGGSISHNHLLFLWHAIDSCLENAEWERAGAYARALEAYTRPEPLLWADFIIARADALIAWGRGRRDAALETELRRLHSQGIDAGFRIGLSMIERALAGTALA